MTNKEKIKSWRNRLSDLGLAGSHKHFCDYVGIDAAMLSRYLKGRQIPTAFMIDKIEKAIEDLKEGKEQYARIEQIEER